MNLFPKQKNDFSETVPTDTKVVLTSQSAEKKEHPLAEIIRFAILALIIVLPIRWFVAQPFIVSGASMENTFHDGSYLIVDQISYYLDDPKRGDVVIFRYPRDPSKFFIKRVIGLPGDRVIIEGDVIKIYNEEHPQGIILDEPYVDNMEPSPNIEEKLGEGEYYVMGDNRDASSDSRIWGVLTRDKIIGRAFLRLYPVDEIGVFPGEDRSNQDLKESITSPN
jgi:signal peptidase I